MTSTSFDLPAPLLAWLDTQAQKKDMSRNALVVMLLTREMQAGDGALLRVHDVRLKELELRLNVIAARVSDGV